MSPRAEVPTTSDAPPLTSLRKSVDHTGVACTAAARHFSPLEQIVVNNRSKQRLSATPQGTLKVEVAQSSQMEPPRSPCGPTLWSCLETPSHMRVTPLLVKGSR